jgi:hypothetical protein
MLSLRMMIFAGIAGICLWGLSMLLDSLKEPALLRTQKGIAVKGCGSLDTHKDSPRLCPPLLCQKALVDRKLVGLQDGVEITKDIEIDGARLVAGLFEGKGQHFACEVDGLTVKRLELISEDEFEELNPM